MRKGSDDITYAEMADCFSDRSMTVGDIHIAMSFSSSGDIVTFGWVAVD